MSADHTPGPWLYAQEGVTSWGIVKPDGYSIVHLVALLNSTSARELPANARLIAAAPDLLKALQRITHPAADDADLQNALQVIAQATGKATA